MTISQIPESANEPLPEKLSGLVASFVNKARDNLEKDGFLAPVAFVGNSTTENVVAVVLDAGSEEAKDASADHLRKLAELTEADFVFTIMDSWGLPQNRVKDYDKIVKRYGSIGQSPYRVNTVSFMLETRTGNWAAQAKQEKAGLSSRKKTFGEPRFLSMASEGRFANLLKPLED
jgi:CRISPR/Cas system CMR-associated protein Cmr5 small subunit